MIRSTLLVTPLVIAAAAALAACSKNEPAAPAAPQAASAAAPQTQAAAPAAQAPAQNTGKVLQMQNGGGYTYAEVETGAGQKVWIAGSQIDVKPGDMVQWGSYAVMRDFHAKSLDRTFPEILFVNQWGPAGAAPVATAPHGTFPQPPAPGSAGMNDSGVVKSVVTGGGYSYIEVDRNGSTVWVAAMETPMKPGDKVQWAGGTEMSNFTAKSIGRTFDKIIFASAVNVTQ